MRRREKNRRGFGGFGFPTILITFSMICIMTFSALALLTANSDYRLSRKVADKTTAYYEAQEKAYEHLEAIDDLLADAMKNSSGKKDYAKEYYALASDALAQYGSAHPEISLSLIESEDALSVRCEIPVTETQNLIVGLNVRDPLTSGGVFYDLTHWQTLTRLPADIDDQPLNLLGS